MSRHVLTLNELPGDVLLDLVERGLGYARGARDPRGRLRDKVIGIWFRKTSTRTRTSFSVGALRLGASIVTYGPHDLQTETGETLEDTARVLSGMLDGLVLRSAGPPEELRALAAPGGMSVINAMSADEHPTQAICDLVTLKECFGRLERLRLLYVGEGNNTATALALAFARLPGAQAHFRTPPGYGLPADKLSQARALAARSGAEVLEAHDMADLPVGVHAVYGTRWQTTGTSKPDPAWRDTFAPFRITTSLMRAVSGPDTVFMHDLPAHRGEDVEAAVLDGERSVAFRQAQNKLHGALAVLEWALDGASEVQL